SALKVDGKKLCDLARQGVTVERAARPVKIHEIEILSMELPRVKIRVYCSKGTYIRTLCQDIGEALGCGACMETLLRTRVSGFCVDEALTLAEIEERVKRQGASVPPEQWNRDTFDFIHSVDSVFLTYEKAVVRKEYNKLLYNGNRLEPGFFTEAVGKNESLRIYDEEGHFIGIYAYSSGRKDYKPVKVFMEQ
ncbi:MAG: tRNA pseudouridine(55) synthase, partial [Roseburia sp.]